METDGEGKFVSFKVVLGGTSLFAMNHGPAGLDCLVCRFYWSTGAAEGLIMVDSAACLRGEIPRKVFFFVCNSFCGQNVDVDREKAGGPTIARSLSYARSFALSVSACSLVWREREGEQTRKSGRRDLLKWTSFVCFFRCTARPWPVKNELFFINGVVDGTSGERFLTITFRISSVKYRVYFLVVCLFFSALPR